MKLFHNSILYTPEQEGNGTPNSELEAQRLEELKIAPLEIGEEDVSSKEIESAKVEDVDLGELLEGLVHELDQQETEAKRSPFEIDEESGLSLQGQTVQEIQDRLAILEKREATDIEELIISSREEEQGQLQSLLETVKSSQDHISQQIQVAFNQFKSKHPDSSIIREEFIAANETLQKIVTANIEQVQQAEQTITEFEADTKRLIDEAYETEIQKTKDRLEALKPEYEGSEAEKHDKQVLLERKLESLLNNPEELFNDAHIAEILAVYGLQKGQEKLQNLQEQSQQAQEQQQKDDIKEEILKNIYWSKDEIPELTQAINADIEAKLKQLQEQYSDLEPITIALKLSGKDRFAYLLDSEDPELEQLAFWSSSKGDKNWANILAEHPQLRQYVENQVNRTFADREQKKEDFHIQREKQSQERITTTIENGVQRYKQKESQQLQILLQEIQNGDLGEALSKDEIALASKGQLNESQIGIFKEGVAKGLEVGIEFSSDGFINTFDAPALNGEINKTMDSTLDKLKSYLLAIEEGKYVINTVDNTQGVLSTIENDIAQEDGKRLFKNKEKISQLTTIKEEIEKASEAYSQLKADKEKNTQKWMLLRDQTTGLNNLYNKLPPYIQQRLRGIGSPDILTIMESAVQELQQYETSSEVQATKDRIKELQQQIEVLQGIK